jgi:aminomethyltransferase
MGKQTALYAQHQAANAKLVDFSGWDMPIHYGSQIKEHEVVRESAGMFDVSHMTIVDAKGAGSKAFLQYLLANDVDCLAEKGKALYSGMLNLDGGVIDDLIVYWLEDDFWRLVVNCGTREKDLAWLDLQKQGFDVELTERDDLSIVAIQGPQAIEKVKAATSQGAVIDSLKIFQGKDAEGWFFARTGYTGEDGLEVMVPNELVEQFWLDLLAQNVAVCGLGARDTLRLEAGMNLYGQEMDDSVSPWHANMGWTIKLNEDRNFVGREALENTAKDQKLVGLVLETRGVMRGHQAILNAAGDKIGEITSGSFSPSMKQSIAMARVSSKEDGELFVDMRGKAVPVKRVKMPFVRNGKVLV